MAQNAWKKTQYRRLLILLDFAERNLPEEQMRRLGLRLIQITQAVDALARTPRYGVNHVHITGVITELESAHLTY